MSKQTEDATHLIAQAAQDACKVISNAAEQAKAVMATDAKNFTQVKSRGGFMDVLYKQVSFYLSIFTIIIGGFIYLTNPSRDNDTALKLQDQRITAQRVTIDELTKTSQNDTQEVKAAVKDLVNEVNKLNTEVATLTAIINERIPAKVK